MSRLNPALMGGLLLLTGCASMATAPGIARGVTVALQIDLPTPRDEGPKYGLLTMFGASAASYPNATIDYTILTSSGAVASSAQGSVGQQVSFSQIPPATYTFKAVGYKTSVSDASSYGTVTQAITQNTTVSIKAYQRLKTDGVSPVPGLNSGAGGDQFEFLGTGSALRVTLSSISGGTPTLSKGQQLDQSDFTSVSGTTYDVSTTAGAWYYFKVVGSGSSGTTYTASVGPVPATYTVVVGAY